MNTLFNLYDKFLNIFPSQIHGLISLVLFVLLVISIFKTIKKEFIWIIVIMILLPTSIPIITNIWKLIKEILSFLLSKSGL